MQTSQSGARSAVIAPRRSWIAIAIPSAVLAATVGVVVWSGWPTIRPVQTVRVAQAVFERTLEREQSANQPTPVGAGGARTVQAAGWLEAEPFYVAAAALADGVVEQIDVLEGDRVRQGDVVARLVSADSELRLARAQAELEGAKAGLDLAEAELRAAQTAWDEPVELERAVESGRAAVAESDAELMQLPALIASERATLVRLEEELSRSEQAEAGGAATDIEVIRARQQAAAQQASVRALEAREPILRARASRLQAELRAAERNLELRVQERFRLDAAHAGLARAKAALANATAARDEAALELERMVIRSPIDGYVQARLKVPGDKVARMMDDPHSAHLVHLYDPEHVQARVDVPLADAAEVYVGQPCEVVVEVLPDRTFAGEVLRVTHEADLQKNTLQVKVRVIDPSPILRPEMLTRVRFLPRTDAGGSSSEVESPSEARSLAPREAIDETKGDPRVWAVRDREGDRGRLEPIAVKVLGESKGWLRVEGALSPGDLLVVGGTRLGAGDRVRIEAASEGGGS